MSDTDAKRELITDQAGREASGGHKYGRYLEEFELGDYASNLVGGDTNADTDAFVNDRGATQRVSVSSAGHQGNASSFAGSIATGCGAAGRMPSATVRTLHEVGREPPRGRFNNRGVVMPMKLANSGEARWLHTGSLSQRGRVSGGSRQEGEGPARFGAMQETA